MIIQVESPPHSPPGLADVYPGEVWLWEVGGMAGGVDVVLAGPAVLSDRL